MPFDIDPALGDDPRVVTSLFQEQGRHVPARVVGRIGFRECRTHTLSVDWSGNQRQPSPEWNWIHFHSRHPRSRRVWQFVLCNNLRLWSPALLHKTSCEPSSGSSGYEALERSSHANCSDNWLAQLLGVTFENGGPRWARQQSSERWVRVGWVRQCRNEVDGSVCPCVRTSMRCGASRHKFSVAAASARPETFSRDTVLSHWTLLSVSELPLSLSTLRAAHFLAVAIPCALRSREYWCTDRWLYWAFDLCFCHT